jgi:hypothetical protein
MRLVKRLSIFVAAAALSLTTVACGGGGDDDDEPPMQGEVDPAGTDTQFVVDELLLPTTATQANMFGINLDGDDQGRPDNALGSILSTLASQGDADLQGAVDEQIAMGDIVLLANVKATDLTMATGVGTWIYLGENPSVDPCDDIDDMVCGNHLDGTASFDVSADSPRDALVVGNVLGGQYTGGPGTITIELSLIEGSSLTLDLIGAQIEVQQMSATGLMSGKIGGAITEQDLNNTVLPALVDILADTFVDDCPEPRTAPDCCEDGSTGQTLMDLFDEDDTCEVTLLELQNNSLISSLLAPDVDLLDCPSADSDPSECAFFPRQDEVKDSLSLGIGFSAVPGTFTIP